MKIYTRPAWLKIQFTFSDGLNEEAHPPGTKVELQTKPLAYNFRNELWVCLSHDFLMAAWISPKYLADSPLEALIPIGNSPDS